MINKKKLTNIILIISLVLISSLMIIFLIQSNIITGGFNIITGRMITILSEEPGKVSGDFNSSLLNFNSLKTKSHPYMLFNSSDIPALQTRWKSPDSNSPQSYIQEDITNEANSNIYTTFPNMAFGHNHLSLGFGHGVGQRVDNWAFSYLMNSTGETTGTCPYSDCTYLNLAKQALLDMNKNDQYFDGQSNAWTLDSSKGLLDYCSAYDMIESVLDETNKTIIKNNIAYEMSRIYAWFNYTVPDKDWTDAINIVTARTEALATIAFCSMVIPNHVNSTMFICRKADGAQDPPNSCPEGELVDDSNPMSGYSFTMDFSSEWMFNWSINGLFGTARERIAGTEYGNKFWYRTFSRDGISLAGNQYERWAIATSFPLFMSLKVNYPDNDPFSYSSIISVWEKYAYTASNAGRFDDNSGFIGFQFAYNKAAIMDIPKSAFAYIPLIVDDTVRDDMYFWWKKKWDATKSSWTDFHTIEAFVAINDTAVTEFKTTNTPIVYDFYAPEGGKAVMKSGYEINDSLIFIDGTTIGMASNQDREDEGTFIFESRGEQLIMGAANLNSANFLVPDTWWNTTPYPFPDPDNQGGSNSQNFDWSQSTAQHNTYLIDGYGQKMSIVNTEYSAFEPKPDPTSLVEQFTLNDFSFTRSNMSYGAVTQIRDNITIYRNFLFPNRDYLIVIDRITSINGITHNYTNQLHIGTPRSQDISESGTLSIVDNNTFNFTTPRSLNFYGKFISPDLLEINYIESNHSQYWGGGDSYYGHYHMRTVAEAQDTDFINILIPRFNSETQPIISELSAENGYAGLIQDGNINETITLKNASFVSVNNINTTAEISFTRENSSNLIYYFIHNATGYNYKNKRYFNSTENIILFLNYSESITGKIQQLNQSEVGSTDVSIYSENTINNVTINGETIAFTYSDNMAHFTISDFGDIVMSLGDVNDTIPPIISNLRNTSTTNTTSTIEWSTDETTNATILLYNNTIMGPNYLFNTSYIANFASSHSINYYGLTNNTIYYINLTIWDISGNNNSNNSFSFMTSRILEEDTTPPNINSIANQSTTNESSYITINTDENSNLSIAWGYSTNNLINTNINNTYQAITSIYLSGLNPNSSIYYNVTSCDTSGNCAKQGIYNFSTEANAIQIWDTTPPSIISVSNQSTTNESSYINVNTNEDTNLSIIWGYSENNLTNTVTNTTYQSNSTAYLSELTPNSTIHYNITNCDVSGNCAKQGIYNFSTSPNITPDDTTEEETEETSSSSSGGGGGGGASTANIITLMDEWSIVELRTSQKLVFDYKKEQHHLFIDKVDENNVELSIYSERTQVKLKKGEVRKVDIDKDGNHDIEIAFYGKEGTKTKIGLKITGHTVIKLEQEENSKKMNGEAEKERETKEEIIMRVEEIPSPKEKSWMEKYWITLLILTLSLSLIFIGKGIKSLQNFNSVSNTNEKKKSNKRKTDSKKYKKLRDYIRGCLKDKYSKKNILKKCTSVGYRKKVVEQILEEKTK